MLSDKIKTQFRLLQDLYGNLYGIDCTYLSAPYDKAYRFDKGLREMIWGIDNNAELTSYLATETEPYTAYIIHSKLEFYHIMCIIPRENNLPDLIAVGPFRSTDSNTSAFRRLLESAKLSEVDLFHISTVYRSLPVADPDRIASSMLRILSEADPSLFRREPIHYEFSNAMRPAAPNRDTIADLARSDMLQLQERLAIYEQALHQGKTKEAQAAFRTILRQTGIARNFSLNEKKEAALLLVLYSISSFLHSPLRHSSLFLSTGRLRHSIQAAASDRALMALLDRTVEQFCLVVRSRLASPYSPLVQEILEYLSSHLEEDLSLAAIAEIFDRNPSALSNLIHKETGKTLTDHVRSVRCKAAGELLRGSDLSVSEIAQRCGYEDFSYFSRQFRKETGCPPSVYRKQTDSTA